MGSGLGRAVSPIQTRPDMQMPRRGLAKATQRPLAVAQGRLGIFFAR